MNPVVILLAAAFTGVVCLSAGLLFIKWLRLPLLRGERLPLAFLLGSAGLSTAVFISLVWWVARPWFFGLTGAAVVALCVWKRAWASQDPEPLSERLSTGWRLVFVLPIVVYGTYSFIYAMAPEMSPDGTAYHLGLVGRYFRTGGFSWYTENMYAHLPMGVEMLFLFAYAFGRHSAAALVHWQFLLVMPFLLLAVGRRFGRPKTGAIAGLVAFLSPVMLLDGSTAYVDVAAGAVFCGLFLSLIAWEQTRAAQWLPVVGILAGFSYCCKMTSAPAVPFALLYVGFVLLRRREWSWRSVATVALIAGAIIAPWLIKNTLIAGNPFAPFLNAYFPNPNVRISFEEDYRAQYRTYYGVITHWWQIPLEVTVRGGVLNGLLGPLFLLTPLALLSLRWPMRRRALIAAAFMASTFPGNIGTRFLIAATPMLALALANLFDEWRVGVAVVAFQSLLAWPDVINVYSDKYSWHIDRFRWTQAWRREAEDTFLRRMLDNYQMARIADARVPADGRIFTFGGFAESYTSRDVTVAYQSGRGNAAGEILAAGVAADIVASRAVTFSFPARHARRVRLVQTAATPQIWSISELRVLAPSSREYKREQWWRVKASPNPWDVQWAFDNCPVTRWKAWEKSHPGQYVEVDFIKPVELGGIRAETSTDQPDTRMRVEIETSPGRWETVTSDPVIVPLPPPANVRRIASDDLKRLGYSHLIVAKGEFLADDVFRNESVWGLTRIGETTQARLYRLD